ncbi:MAG: transglutaminase family protein, partial [Limnobacter sp.]|nr:transglutaminase family protein [Limnobacter sp.]
LVFPEKTDHFEIAVDLMVEMSVLNPFDFFLEEHAETMPFKYGKNLTKELAPYLKKRRSEKAYSEYLKTLTPPQGRTIDWLVQINQKLCSDISYTIRMEPGVQSPGTTLKLRSGSCRDSAWLMVQIMRSFGYAARFVSGYLIQLTSDVKAIDGPNGPEADFTDLHAWCEVYLPGAGWIGFDPTSGLLAGEGHIPLACSADPSSAAPIEGGLDECEVTFGHEMSVTRIYESPRTSKPYSENQWEAIKALGHEVDAVLKANDVRLTMGGEPTFVADSDRGEAEWNTDALGPTKRKYGMTLMNRLRQFYGRGGVLHCGQGKWYPGEQLPRWAMTFVWRKDGHPIWNNPDLLANDEKPGKTPAEVSGPFMEAVAEELGLATDHILPGYEDAWYFLWRERRLPANVDPFDSRLEDELERKRLAKVFRDGLDKPIGYCLPLSKRNGFWETGPWFLREERMYLIPGDSPMGFRLPLDSQPWVAKKDYPYQV